MLTRFCASFAVVWTIKFLEHGAMNHANITPPSRTRSLWKTMAVFAALGPIVGSLIVWLVMVLFNGKEMSLAEAGTLSWLTLLFGYVFGILPAALTGLAVASSIKAHPHQPAAWLGAIWGAIWAGLAGFLVAWTGDGGARFAFTIVLFAITGASAGLVCGWLLRDRGPR